MTTSPHRYTYPATPPPSDADARLLEVRATSVLAGYGLTLEQAIEVELLVTGQPSQVAPRLVEGTIVGATEAALMLEATPGRRTTRVPWSAVALIRDAITHHPAL